MFYIIKKINYDKINTKYIYKKDIYKIYYNIDKHINIIGIPLSFKYEKIKINYNLIYIYFNNVDILECINKIIYKNIGIYIIKNDVENNESYIVCKNTNNKIIQKNNIKINISKIIKHNNKYVPLIYII
jgi:hypothetical protein